MSKVYEYGGHHYADVYDDIGGGENLAGLDVRLIGIGSLQQAQGGPITEQRQESNTEHQPHVRHYLGP